MARVEDRPHGIGSSDAAAACGMSPWKSPYWLCLEKMGTLQPDPPTLRMRLGNVLEPFVADLYAEATGDKLYEAQIAVHSELPWCFASPDRLTESGKLLEIKTAGQWSQEWGPPGTNEIPEHYLIQVHHQMACTGWDYCDVAVLFGREDFAIYCVPRNDALIAEILRREAEFWRWVEQRTPPPPDYSDPSTQRLIAAIHGVEDREIALPEDHFLLAADEMEKAKAEVKRWSHLRDQHKARLLDAMGDAARALLSDGTVLTRKRVERRGYEVQPTSYVSFKIRRPE